ncbi:MAG TPA: hypothetical protein VKE94_23880 [Gemmataceae bacterium]|nr:hypothetical protein [Gemmataceae bacterium]
MSRFHAEQYKPEGGFSVIGLAILLVALCAAGVGLGWLASFLSQWFYLIVLFPAGIGFCLLLVGLVVGQHTKMRSRSLSVLLGLISSGVAMLSMHYFDYQRFLHERQELLKEVAPLDNLPAGDVDAQTAEALQHLKQIRAVESFPSYLNQEATQGVTISRLGKDGMNLGYVGTWIYWGFELVVVAAMVTLGLVGGAAEPFCSACDSWKQARRLGTLQRKDADVAALLSNGEIERLQEHDPAPTGGNLILTAAVCPNCKSDSPIAVKLEEVTKNEKGEESKNKLIHLVYPGEALAAFEALFANKPELTEEKGAAAP